MYAYQRVHVTDHIVQADRLDNLSNFINQQYTERQTSRYLLHTHTHPPVGQSRLSIAIVCLSVCLSVCHPYEKRKVRQGGGGKARITRWPVINMHLLGFCLPRLSLCQPKMKRKDPFFSFLFFLSSDS